MNKPVSLSLIDAAQVINLLRSAGWHPEHERIADDLSWQMLNHQGAPHARQQGQAPTNT